jgi:hypothetical protein
MTIHNLPRDSLAEYRDRCIADYYDYRLRRYYPSDPCDCDDGELIPWLVKWQAGFAEKRAVVAKLKARAGG